MAGLTQEIFVVLALDVRNEDRSGALRHIPISPCRYAHGRLRTFYHSDYFRSAQRHDDVKPFDDMAPVKKRYEHDAQVLVDVFRLAAVVDLVVRRRTEE